MTITSEQYDEFESDYMDQLSAPDVQVERIFTVRDAIERLMTFGKHREICEMIKREGGLRITPGGETRLNLPAKDIGLFVNKAAILSRVYQSRQQGRQSAEQSPS